MKVDKDIYNLNFQKCDQESEPNHICNISCQKQLSVTHGKQHSTEIDILFQVNNIEMTWNSEVYPFILSNVVTKSNYNISFDIKQ